MVTKKELYDEMVNDTHKEDTCTVQSGLFFEDIIGPLSYVDLKAKEIQVVGRIHIDSQKPDCLSMRLTVFHETLISSKGNTDYPKLAEEVFGEDWNLHVEALAAEITRAVLAEQTEIISDNDWTIKLSDICVPDPTEFEIWEYLNS